MYGKLIYAYTQGILVISSNSNYFPKAFLPNTVPFRAMAFDTGILRGINFQSTVDAI